MTFFRASAFLIFGMATILVAMLSGPTSAQNIQAFAGDWDASLESPGGPIQFGLRVESTYRKKLTATIFNGSAESIEIPEVSIEDSTLVLNIAHYDSQIALTKDTSNDRLVGDWRKRRGTDKWAEMKVNAEKIVDRKDTGNDEFDAKFSGQWTVKFSSSNDPAIAIFKRTDVESTKGNSFPNIRPISGTFLTTTGDYRFLAGSQSGPDEVTLSCFDGAHAFLFKMKSQSDGSLKGDFWSANTWHETWTATRDENAKLPDAFTQTTKTDTKITSLSFPDLEGIMTSLDDKRFAGKARLIYVFGSWCPNCHDAAAYFSALQKKYEGQDFSILGLAFELTDDSERNAKQIRKYLVRHGCTYPVLIAGPSDKKLATKAFPVLDRVRSYPTTLFVDGEGNIKAVHTGFTGPATGKAFEELKTKFESQIEAMLND
jgi:thiol-disulfide isomerase/thioredoxin